MHELYATLFDIEEVALKESLVSRFEVMDTDLLVLDYIVLSPKWRGLKLGLLAARRMIDLLGHGCGLTIAEIVPFGPGANEALGIPASWVPAGNPREGAKRLRRYFRRMGFERVGRTPYYGMSMARKAPGAADLIRPAGTK